MKNCSTRISTAAVVLGVWLATAQVAFASHFSSYQPAPRGLILVARPTIYWPLFLGSDTSIRDLTLTINGVTQEMTYDPLAQVCVSILDKPLATGDYIGKITVSFDDGSTYDKVWQFSISPDAISDFPTPDSSQPAAMNAVNAVRRACGLLDVRLNPALNEAAAAHCGYMKLNDAYSHLEASGKPGFTGVTPEDRVAAWGYPLGDYEDISAETSSMDKMVVGLMDAPYHRAAFLQPGAPDFGYSGEGGKSTLEFGITGLSGVSVYPYAGQADVPISWTDDEFPDPLRIHPGAASVVGYPVTLYYYGPAGSAISVASATLTAPDGTDVPTYVNRDANDTELSAGVIIFPQTPLEHGTAYTVKITGSTLDGMDISRTWTFTTAPAAK